MHRTKNEEIKWDLIYWLIRGLTTEKAVGVVATIYGETKERIGTICLEVKRDYRL